MLRHVYEHTLKNEIKEELRECIPWHKKLIYNYHLLGFPSLSESTTIPSMKRWQAVVVAICYFVVLAVLYLILWSASGIPAANDALEMLIPGPALKTRNNSED